MRAELNRLLDEMRKNKSLGSNLEAEVSYPLPAEDPLLQKMHASGELKYFLITSSFSDADAISVKVTTSKKCSRCWHYTPDVQAICGRCEANLKGAGVARQFF